MSLKKSPGQDEISNGLLKELFLKGLFLCNITKLSLGNDAVHVKMKIARRSSSSNDGCALKSNRKSIRLMNFDAGADVKCASVKKNPDGEGQV